MNAYFQALAAEILKTRRALVSWLILLAVSLWPLGGGFFMVILKDPAGARDMGIISTKARLVGTADWPTFMGMLAQMIGAGGLILFGFVAAWMFGREFSERTVRQLLAVPTPRTTILSAKFTVLAGGCALLTAWVFLLGWGIGLWIGMPGYSRGLILAGAGKMAVAAALTIALQSVVAWFASFGRGYLAALGFVFLTMFLGQMAGVMGWGEWFPWSVPPIYSGAAGAQTLTAGSYVLVALASAAGLAGTFAWWNRADHTT